MASLATDTLAVRFVAYAAGAYFVLKIAEIVLSSLRVVFPQLSATTVVENVLRHWTGSPSLYEKVKWPLAVLCVALVFFIGGYGYYYADEMDAEGGGSYLTLGPVQTLVVGQVAVPYYLRPFFVDVNEKQIPIVDCAYVRFVDKVHHQVLGDLAPAPRRVPIIESEFDVGLMSEQRRVDDVEAKKRNKALAHRERALQRCGLTLAHVHALSDAGPAFEAHVIRPPFWSTSTSPAIIHAIGERRVAQVIVARNNTRYFRVAAVRQIAGSASYRLVPSLVKEEDLIQAADEWVERLAVLNGPSDGNAHCLCMAHFGIVESGLFFYYVPKLERWAIHAAVEVAFNLSFSNAESTLFWRDRPLTFPAVVDGLYGVERLSYSSKILLRFYDSATSFSDETFVKAVRKIDAAWGSGTFNTSVSPFAYVVPFSELTPVKLRIEDENENACVHHCLAVEQTSAERYKQWSASSVLKL